MVKCKMLKTLKGVPMGIVPRKVLTYEAGVEYDLPENLEKTWIGSGDAEYVKATPPPKTEKKAAKETKAEMGAPENKSE